MSSPFFFSVDLRWSKFGTADFPRPILSTHALRGRPPPRFVLNFFPPRIGGPRKGDLVGPRRHCDPERLVLARQTPQALLSRPPLHFLFDPILENPFTCTGTFRGNVFAGGLTSVNP